MAMNLPRLSLLILAAMLGWPAAGLAHPAHLSTGTLRIRPDGAFQLSVRFDVLAFALNDTSMHIADEPMNALLDGSAGALQKRLDDARDRFLQDTQVMTNAGVARVKSSTFPTVQQVEDWKKAGLTPRLPVILKASLEGALPQGAREVRVQFPEIFDTIVLTVDRPDEEPYTTPVEPGKISETLPIRLGVTPVATASEGLRLTGKTGVAMRFVAIGFHHILPEGLDHILFVLGLFLLSVHWRPLLYQITAFTVAHSVSLGLCMYGVVHLSPRVVEPLIALSIVYVAVENICTKDLSRWRTVIVFSFGLVHGLGFADALKELGLQRSEFLASLIGFNAGVELGQLTVIAMAFAAVGWCCHRDYYRRRVVIPSSGLIAVTAMVWTIQRLL